VPLELVTTDGIFALDGGEWEVTNNIWLLGDDREVLVFDAAHDHSPIVEAINGRRVVAIVLTHPDDQMLWDAVWPNDSLDGSLSTDVVLRAGGHELNVLHTPGHSPGCCCFHDAGSGMLFSGDTLFCGGPGATGRSYSDEPTILRSIITKLLQLPPETVVHTGHGDSTTIGAERDGVTERARELGIV
jgi:glyoxylase-like metal-dependent hydrolase (beta-lactamase superfamily II)